MADEKRRLGRPPLPAGEAKMSQLSLRVTRATRQRMQAAADASGRSLSSEMEHRLERSLLMEDVGAWLDRRALAKDVAVQVRDAALLESRAGGFTTTAAPAGAAEFVEVPPGAKREDAS